MHAYIDSIKPNLRPYTSAKEFSIKEIAKSTDIHSLPTRLASHNQLRLITPTTLSVRTSKTKNKAINLEIEKLYEENQSLKQAVNSLSDENLRLKTRLAQNQRSADKRVNENSFISHNRDKSSSHLIENLKQSISEMKQELENKEKIIIELKKNMKTTKMNELTEELKIFKEECTRIRGLYDAVNKEKIELSKKNLNFEKINHEKNMLEQKLKDTERESALKHKKLEDSQLIKSNESSIKLKALENSNKLSIKTKIEEKIDFKQNRKFQSSPLKKLIKLEDEIKNLKAENSGMNSKINELTKENQKLIDLLKTKQKEIENLTLYPEKSKFENELQAPIIASPSRHLFIDEDLTSDEDKFENSEPLINSLLKKILALVKLKNYSLESWISSISVNGIISLDNIISALKFERVPIIKKEVELLIKKKGENSSQILESVLINELKNCLKINNEEKIDEFDNEKIIKALQCIRTQMIIDNSVDLQGYFFENNYGFQSLYQALQRIIGDEEVLKEICGFLLNEQKIISKEDLIKNLDNLMNSLDISIDQGKKDELKRKIKNKLKLIGNHFSEMDKGCIGLLPISLIMSQLRALDIIETSIEENWLFKQLIKYQSSKGLIYYDSYFSKFVSASNSQMSSEKSYGSDSSFSEVNENEIIAET
ncbi:unnamed protein product [Blepharisma stoltei]|uniref:Uncharacterized protein n=1 Tax=Blepharisma stoltei TaxID=1481888 RepID=A0AAU9JMN4_9CILI|nr:unnamed protein product [Blepharisma stoltei]